MVAKCPSGQIEAALFEQGVATLAGIDEVGRGSLLGPVVAGVVSCHRHTVWPDGLADSKKLTENRRQRLFVDLIQTQIDFTIAMATQVEIDRMGILAANFLAMRRAIKKLTTKPALILVDGHLPIKGYSGKQRSVVRGDEQCFCIAAASILAKVTRDHMIVTASKHFPGYAMEKHKGYGTKLHKECLHHLGYSSFHRKSFHAHL